MLFHFFHLVLFLVIVKLVGLLVAIAFYTLAERKIMGASQRRHGPDVVGFWGLLQPLADGLKLLAKELVIPVQANSRIFALAPLSVLTLALLAWVVIPFHSFDYSAVLVVAIVVTTLARALNESYQAYLMFVPTFGPDHPWRTKFYYPKISTWRVYWSLLKGGYYSHYYKPAVIPAILAVTIMREFELKESHIVGLLLTDLISDIVSPSFGHPLDTMEGGRRVLLLATGLLLPEQKVLYESYGRDMADQAFTVVVKFVKKYPAAGRDLGFTMRMMFALHSAMAGNFLHFPNVGSERAFIRGFLKRIAERVDCQESFIANCNKVEYEPALAQAISGASDAEAEEYVRTCHQLGEQGARAHNALNKYLTDIFEDSE